MAQTFTVVRGAAAPLLLPDINTDVISPAHSDQTDPARRAFGPLRYLPDGTADPNFVLNQQAFAGAPILLAADNFGCGSSRESAVWALVALGIRCVIAPSFGDIFFGNCFQNGLLPIVLDRQAIDELAAEAADGQAVEVDLRTCRVTTPSGRTIPFEVDPPHREQLLDGLDELDIAVRRRPAVRTFQQLDRQRRPWVYDAPALARLATPDDAAELARLLHDFNVEFATPSPGPDVLADRLRALLGTGTTFAVLAGHPSLAAALVTLRTNVWYDGPVALLDEMYVVPRRRGQGIGSQVVDLLVHTCRIRGVRLIEINVDETDVDAQRFYERHGFRGTSEHGERAFYYEMDL